MILCNKQQLTTPLNRSTESRHETAGDLKLGREALPLTPLRGGAGGGGVALSLLTLSGSWQPDPVPHMAAHSIS